MEVAAVFGELQLFECSMSAALWEILCAVDAAVKMQVENVMRT